MSTRNSHDMLNGIMCYRVYNFMNYIRLGFLFLTLYGLIKGTVLRFLNIAACTCDNSYITNFIKKLIINIIILLFNKNRINILLLILIIKYCFII